MKVDSKRIPPPTSITHLHLLASLISEMRGRRALRVVDVGCGDGRLTAYLRASIPALLPDCHVDVCGFDVSDRTPHGNDKLSAGTPTVKIGEAWPYDDVSVDVILSNQVLEHVFDHEFFFRQVARCLKPNGASIHLFPLKSVIYEDHVGIPLAHRIRNRHWIRLMARIGFFDQARAIALPNPDHRDFAECAVDYLNKYTNYVGRREIKRLARDAGLHASFRYTPRIYSAKARSISNAPARYYYPNTPRLDELWSRIGALVAGITLVLHHRGDVMRA